MNDQTIIRVGDVMTPLVHAVSADATVDAVARLMTRKHIHRVIVRSGRRAAGVISALDVLRAMVGAERSAGAKRRRPAAATRPKKRPGATRRATR